MNDLQQQNLDFEQEYRGISDGFEPRKVIYFLKAASEPSIIPAFIPSGLILRYLYIWH
jgi:hypothetical protein